MTSGDHAMTCKTRPVLLLALVFLSVLSVLADSQQRNFAKPHTRMQKLCSRSLSDALYLVCKERGYNEPFSYSGEDEPRVDPGPGLVEECCYHSCSLEQLERYCKPLPEKRADSRHDVIEEPYLMKIPYPTMRDLSSEQSSRSEMDYVSDTIKRKVDSREERHRGNGDRNIDECKGKPGAKKRHRGRHCRRRRRRLGCCRAGKIPRGDAKPLDNKFVTSSPTEKPTLFPSIS